MTTFRIDDPGDFLRHSPVATLIDDCNLAAVGLWTLCALWSADSGSQGFIPDAIVRRHGASERQVRELLATGLWWKADGGFRMNRWEAFIALEPTKQVARRAPAAERPRGTRIPRQFPITDSMREFHAERFAHVDIDLETEKFVNYWDSKSGAGATKIQWEKVWQNWIITAAERTPKAAGKPTKADTTRSIIEQGRALDAAAGRKSIGA